MCTMQFPCRGCHHVGIFETIWFVFALAFVTATFAAAYADALKNGKGVTAGTLPRFIYKNFWMFLETIFSRGCHRYPASRISKTLLLLWTFGILVWTHALYSQFKAALMVKQDEDIMKRVQDLEKRPHLLPLLYKNTPLIEYFRDSPLKHIRYVYDRASKDGKGIVSTVSIAVPQTYINVRNGKWIIFTEISLHNSIMSMICNLIKGERKLYFAEEEIMPVATVFNIQKYWPKFLQIKVDQRILWMMEGGFFNFWFKEYYKGLYKCAGNEDGDPVDISLGLAHLRNVFLMLFACHAVIFLVFLVELSFKRKQVHLGNKEKRLE